MNRSRVSSEAGMIPLLCVNLLLCMQNLMNEVVPESYDELVLRDKVF